MRNTCVPMIASSVAIAVHFPNCLLLTKYSGLGLVKSLGVASSVTNFFLLFVVIVFCACDNSIRRALRAPGRDSFSGWYEYLKVCLPTTLIMCSEWWILEILTVLAGLISVEAQAVHTIAASGSALMFEISLGYQEATCSIIGNCIGAGKVKLARRFFNLILLVTLATTTSLMLVLICCRDAISRFYSTDPIVQ